MQKKAEAAAAAVAEAAAWRLARAAGAPFTEVEPGLLRLTVQRVDGSLGTLALQVAKDAKWCAWKLTVDPRHAGPRRATPFAALESWVAKHGDKLSPFSKKQILSICRGDNGTAATRPPGPSQADGRAVRQRGHSQRDQAKSPQESHGHKRVRGKTEAQPCSAPVGKLLHRPAAKLRSLQELAARRALRARSSQLPRFDNDVDEGGMGEDVQHADLRFQVRRADGSKACLALAATRHTPAFAWQMTTAPRHAGARRDTPFLALEAWLAKHADKLTPESFVELAGVHPPDDYAQSMVDEAASEEGATDGATDDTFAATVAGPRPEEREPVQGEAEVENLVETPPSLQIWTSRTHLLNTLRCSSDACAVAPLGAEAHEDLEELWRSQSCSPSREDSPVHGVYAHGEEALQPQTDSSEDESDSDESDGLPKLSPEDLGSDTEALMPGDSGGIFEVDPEEDELPNGGQSGMMFVSTGDSEEGPESL